VTTADGEVELLGANTDHRGGRERKSTSLPEGAAGVDHLPSRRRPLEILRRCLHQIGGSYWGYLPTANHIRSDRHDSDNTLSGKFQQD
jgi:hypothetical protein